MTLTLLSLLCAVAPPTAMADRHGDALPTGAAVRLGTVRFREPGYGSCVDFAPTGGLVATGGEKGVIVWDARGKRVATIRLRRPGPTEWFYVVECVRFSPDGRRLAIGPREGPVHVWDAVTGRVSALQDMHGSWLTIGFAAGGRQVFAADRDLKRVRVADVDGQTPGRNFFSKELTRETSVRTAVSADGRVVGAVPGGVTQLYDTVTDKSKARILRLWGHSLSRDGRFIAGSHDDEGIGLYDTATGRRASPTMQAGCRWDAATLSPDGLTLVAGDHVFDARTGRVRCLLTGYNEHVRLDGAVSPDGRTFALGLRSDSGIRLWDTRTGEPLGWNDGHAERVIALAFSPEGSAVATAALDRTVRLWDARTGALRHTITFDWPVAVAFAPDGRTLAVAAGREAFLMDVGTGRVVRPLTTGTGLPDRIEHLSFSKDGRKVFAATDDNTYHLDGKTRYQPSPNLRQIPNDVPLGLSHGDAVHADTYSRLSVLEICGRVRCRTPALSDIRSDELFLATRFMRACLSPDGNTIAAVYSNRNVHVFDARDGKPLTRFAAEICFRSGPDDTPMHSPISLSPDGRCVAVCGADGRARVYEIATGNVRITADGPGVIARFSPDGSTLAVTGVGTTVTLWRLRERPSAFPPIAAEREVAWASLSDTDAAKAYRGLLTLAADVPDLASRLVPAKEDSVKFARLAQELDDDAFAVRRHAERELAEVGEPARAALVTAREKATGLEHRRTLDRLLRRLDAPPTGETLRAVRAVEALEIAGSEEARHVLRRLAAGAPGATLTEHAAAALRRTTAKR